MRHGILAALLLFCASLAAAQQVPDTSFQPVITNPAFAPDKGPVVLLDEAHFNFHTAAGRYLPFADLLRRDGYVVTASTKPFTSELLRAGSVLVISNALNERNQTDWKPPIPPAFTQAEVDTVRNWVSAGGALLLIADHTPFSKAAEDLGKAFGIRFLDGGVVSKRHVGPMIFRKSDGTLKDHPITRRIEEVATFTGSSFEIDTRVGEPLLVFGSDAYSMTEPNDPHAVQVTGRLQGAVLPFGKGKVAVFGEAAMFSAQLAGPNKAPMGMNAPVAKQNSQFLLNVIHWLTGVA